MLPLLLGMSLKLMAVKGMHDPKRNSWPLPCPFYLPSPGGEDTGEAIVDLDTAMEAVCWGWQDHLNGLDHLSVCWDSLKHLYSRLFFVVQLLSRVQLFVTAWTAAHQASLSFTISWSLLKLRSIESVMPSNHLILCCPLLLLPSIFPSIRVFSDESALRIRWLKYRSFSFRISPSNEYLGLISFRIAA